MRAAAIIPARGGSRRIQGKNIRPFHGRPILCYSIDTAIASGLFDAGVWVSTDDPAIARVAWDAGAKVHPRQKHLVEDDVGTQQVMAAAARELWPLVEDPTAPVALCCIYPCSPLMTKGDLRIGYGMLAAGLTDYVMSTDQDGKDAGNWYWGRTLAFMNGVPLEGNSSTYRLPKDRVCDINTHEDWERAHWLYRDMQQGACQHDMRVVPHGIPEMVHLRCTKCGFSPPT